MNGAILSTSLSISRVPTKTTSTADQPFAHLVYLAPFDPLVYFADDPLSLRGRCPLAYGDCRSFFTSVRWLAPGERLVLHRLIRLVQMQFLYLTTISGCRDIANGQ